MRKRGIGIACIKSVGWLFARAALCQELIERSVVWLKRAPGQQGQVSFPIIHDAPHGDALAADEAPEVVGPKAEKSPADFLQRVLPKPRSSFTEDACLFGATQGLIGTSLTVCEGQYAPATRRVARPGAGRLVAD